MRHAPPSPPLKGLLAPWAVLSSVLKLHDNARRGYAKFCKGQGLPFSLPTIWTTGGSVLVLPPSALGLLNKPESELRSFEAQLETIQLPYVIPDPVVYRNVLHFDVVRKRMSAKEVGRLAAVTADELDTAFRDVWGRDQSREWRTGNGWEACESVIARVGLRILLGQSLGREKGMITWSKRYSNAVLALSAIINCLPPWLRPVLGPLLAIPAKYYQRQCLKIMVPHVSHMISRWQQDDHDGDGGNDDDEPEFLKWLILTCAEAGTEQLDPVRVTMRLLAVNTMFVSAMAYVFGHAVLNLYSSPNRDEFLRGLEEECQTIASRGPDSPHLPLSCRDSLNELHRVDSALRESMRFSDIGSTGMSRDVMMEKLVLVTRSEDGDGSSSSEVWIPKGTRIVFPTDSIHYDLDCYNDPFVFDAFRFSRPFEAHHREETNDHGAGMRTKRKTMTTVDSSFLAFGYGRHSCPGRWFVSQTLKQALAYLVMNYNVEVVGQLPARRSILNMIMPPHAVQIRSQRKKA